MNDTHDAPRGQRPDLSIVMPCYNEEDNVGYSVRRLVKAFRDTGQRIEIVAVDNGSKDRTGEIIGELAAEFPGVVRPARVDVNQGYGHGILTGIDQTCGEWVGFVAADGQVDAEDVARLFDAALSAQGDVVAKVRRRFRMDGQYRRFISICYNLFVYALYPRLGSLDVNGSPRLLKRELLLKMDIQARNWLFDPEMLIKAYHMDVSVLELNVFSRMRCGGVSQVRMGTCFEFFWNILRFRFTGAFKEWRRDLAAGRLDERVTARLTAESAGAAAQSPARQASVASA